MKEQRLLMAAPVDVQWRLIEPLVNAQGVKWITPETDRSDVTIAAHAAGADNLFHRPTCVLTIKNFTCRDIMPVRVRAGVLCYMSVVQCSWERQVEAASWSQADLVAQNEMSR